MSRARAEQVIQMGMRVTGGLGAGSQPDVGRAAAEEVIDEIRDHLTGAHVVFVTAGMGGGTGTGASPVVAHAARELGILTVGVVTNLRKKEGKTRFVQLSVVLRGDAETSLIRAPRSAASGKVSAELDHCLHGAQHMIDGAERVDRPISL